MTTHPYADPDPSGSLDDSERQRWQVSRGLDDALESDAETRRLLELIRRKRAILSQREGDETDGVGAGPGGGRQ